MIPANLTYHKSSWKSRIKYAFLAALAASLVVCNTIPSSTDSLGSTQYSFQKPPIQKKPRSYPRLVNYFHLRTTKHAR
jgi:hypothetical protein